MKSLVGPSFEELTSEEMKDIQGAGDVKAETTPTTLTVMSIEMFTAGVVTGAAVSIKYC